MKKFKWKEEQKEHLYLKSERVVSTLANEFMQIDDRTVTERQNKGISIDYSYKGKEVMERNARPRPEGTRQ